MSTAYGSRTPAQMYALVFGAIYVLVGLIGFVNDPVLGIFDVNVVHNVIHLAIGGVLLAVAGKPATAKQVTLIVGVVLLLVAVLGFAGILITKGEALNLAIEKGASDPDNWLHLVTGGLAIALSMGGERRVATTA